MKRLLILNYEFPPLGGGGGVAAYKLAKGFIQNGYEVDYITSWYEGLQKFEVVDGINVYRVRVIGRTGLQTATMLSLISFPFAGLLQGIRLCRQYKYEFINTHFVVPSGPLGYVLSRLFKIKNVLSLHGGDIYDPSKKSSPHRSNVIRFVVRFLLNRADILVAQSSNTKENTMKYYGTKKEVRVIPLAYEPYVFAPITKAELGLQVDKKYIIGVGRLVKRKDFTTFIKVIAALDESVHGIIIGDGPEEDSIKALAQSLGIADRIHFVGQVSEERKFQLLAVADVFLLSSLHEGFGIVLQEAMQVGLPIVATNHGGQVDLINDGVNGYLVDVGDVRTMSTKVSDILNHSISSLDISTSVTQFNVHRIASQYSNLLTNKMT